MRAFVRVIELGALGAGYALLFLAFLTTFEIIARKLFNYSIQGVDELGGYALAITASLGFGYAALERAHTRVDFLLRHLPEKVRALIHALAWTILCGQALFMTWHARGAFNETLLYGSIANSPLQTPLWLPQSFWLVGFVIFAASTALMAGRAWKALASGVPGAVDLVAGNPSMDEEIRDAMESTGHSISEAKR